jgi:para-nitrobenzyl esterase
MPARENRLEHHQEFPILTFGSCSVRFSDRRNTALAAVGAQRPPLWRYLYTHRFENSAFLAPYRAFHTAELFFIFGNFGNIAGSKYFPSAAETDFSQAMMGYWTRFAATGNPNGDSAVQWPPYDSVNESMLQLDETFTPINGYHIPQCSSSPNCLSREVALIGQ